MTAHAGTQTYLIDTIADVPAITCRLCGRTSELAGDVTHRYCSRCHLFHETVAEARRLVVDGGTHECSDWRTYRDVCALCGRVLSPRQVVP